MIASSILESLLIQDTPLGWSGLKFAVRGILIPGKRCLCLSAGMGVVITTLRVPLISSMAEGSIFEWGAMGARVRKKGLADFTPSSRSAYPFSAMRSVEYWPL